MLDSSGFQWIEEYAWYDYTMVQGRSYRNFTEAELKHLEFIHNVIDRLSRNCFWLKGWSVTLVAAILAVAAGESSAYLVLVAVFPALAFWGLDAFYLGQERLFRKLHKDVVAGDANVFSMDVSAYETGWAGLVESARSKSVVWFHLVVLFVIGVAALVQWSPI